jgi:hypothetical protein
MIKQKFLPGFPEGSIAIGNTLHILKKDGRVNYFVDSDNYFSHIEGDAQSYRFILATLMKNRHVRARDLTRAPLCIPHRTLMNWSSQLWQKGPESFFRAFPAHTVRVMTPEIALECGVLLAGGKSVAAVSKKLGINDSTLRKAMQRGVIAKIPEVTSENMAIANVTAKSDRSREDAEAASGMGTACTRADERIAAAIGLSECATAHFENCRDVEMGGLLAGMPALCANGLLSGIGNYLKLPAGFYSCLHILLTLGFMALARIRRPEDLRHVAPGELGKVVGLDRVPEVRTLREKITVMANTGNPEAWMKELAKTWMGKDPEEAGYLYVDGHVRVYNGKKALLQRRYVSRQRLCLRGTTDYWINDALGRPFFVVTKAVNEGLSDTLLQDIVPDLLANVPNQPSEAELATQPTLHRFVIVFDREGATHSLISNLWEKRIAAITYRKNVKDVWPESEFVECEVPVPGGGTTRMKLTRRETELTAGKASIPVTEVRRLTETGHQTAIITTARSLGSTVVAGQMFARWCQENFFAYMMKHYDIDGLIQYGTESLPGTVLIVNPAWRNLDKAVRQALNGVRNLEAKLGAEESMDNGVVIQKKAEYVQDIQAAKSELARLRDERRKTPRKVMLDSLPDNQRPTQLLPLNKKLTDTVKMIAYRAETALVALLRCHLEKKDEARALIRALFVSAADIEPNACAGTLTIRIHRMACPSHDKSIAALLEELTKLQFRHPETGQKMIYVLV